MDTITEIKNIINRFQQGYLNRDPDQVAGFMDLFCDDGMIEVIGTGASQKGKGEWCLDQASLQEMIISDWEDWGDLVLDPGSLAIHTHGEAAWFAAAGTVTRTQEPEQSYQNFLGYLKWVTENEPEAAPKDKILDVLRGGLITLADAEQGARYVWPIRLSAVLIREEGQWRFCQMTFSFPTLFPPDLRLTE